MSLSYDGRGGILMAKEEPTMLTIGDTFPKFSVQAVVGLDKGKEFQRITSEDYAGKWKVVFFWPKDFTFVCPTEIAAFARLEKEFRARDAQLLGVSIDSEYVHLAWRREKEELRSLAFPMLADIKRELTGALGVLDPEAGVAQRATYIVDPH